MDAKTLVVTPVYCTKGNQRLPLLLQNIYWVQKQTHRDFMHVIVDDGSTDESPEVLDRIASKRNNVLVVHQSNKGSSAAINVGVEQGLKRYNADYITITHSDDLLTPRSLEVRSSEAINQSSSFVFTDYIILNEQKKRCDLIRAPVFPDRVILYESLKKRPEITHPTMFWERNFFTDSVQGYDSEMTDSEDWDIALRSAAQLRNGHSFISVPFISSIYRWHEHNLTFQNLREGIRWKCQKKMLAKHSEGIEFYRSLLRCGTYILANSLPESVRMYLRPIKYHLLGRPLEKVPEDLEGFISLTRQVNYREALI